MFLWKPVQFFWNEQLQSPCYRENIVSIFISDNHSTNISWDSLCLHSWQQRTRVSQAHLLSTHKHSSGLRNQQTWSREMLGTKTLLTTWCDSGFKAGFYSVATVSFFAHLITFFAPIFSLSLLICSHFSPIWSLSSRPFIHFLCPFVTKNIPTKPKVSGAWRANAVPG